MSTTRGIDLEHLGLRDALDLAVLIEEEARERYAEFVEQMEMHHTPEAAAFFRVMAGSEEKHRAELWRRRRELFPVEAVAVTRSMLFDVEAPDYDEARAFMTERQALESALRAERKAHDFFAAAIPRLSDPLVRALFQELRSEELLHQELVRRRLDALPPDPPFAASDFADEPVAQ